MYKGILDWLTHSEKMTIARDHGVTSERQVYNIIMGRSKNFPLLTALTEKAEANRHLRERARQLEAAAAS